MATKTGIDLDLITCGDELARTAQQAIARRTRHSMNQFTMALEGWRVARESVARHILGLDNPPLFPGEDDVPEGWPQ